MFHATQGLEMDQAEGQRIIVIARPDAVAIVDEFALAFRVVVIKTSKTVMSLGMTFIVARSSGKCGRIQGTGYSAPR